MARYPGAVWRGPVPGSNFTPGGNNPRYHVIHIMQGTLAGTDSEFRTPGIQLSAHFGVGKDGTVYQWVDTDDIAYHAAFANDKSVGVEHEGDSGFPLTKAQLAASARLYAWVHQQHGVPFWLASDPVNGSGLAWHGMGGALWGNHPFCPGVPIRRQLPLMLAGAASGKLPPAGRPVQPIAPGKPGAAGSVAVRLLLVALLTAGAAVVVAGAVVFVTSGAGLAAAAAASGRRTRADF